MKRIQTAIGFLTAIGVLTGCGAAANVSTSAARSPSSKTSVQDGQSSGNSASGLTHLSTVVPYLRNESNPPGPQGEKDSATSDFWVRPGYKLSLVADNLGNARFMCFDSNGTLYLSKPNEGEIVMLRPSGTGYKVSGTFVSGQSKPHGMCFNNGWLWFTTDGHVKKARVTDGKTPASDVQTVLSGLPQGGHWWRSIYVNGPYFFTSIGDQSNVSDDLATDREKIWRYNLDGSGKTLWCSGIRNTEKLMYRPGTTDLFGCDQGSDWFGAPLGDKQGNQPITDFNPPDEFNNYVKGGFYGHPYITGNRIPRYEFINKSDIHELAAKTIPPALCLGAHWAADGWTFLSHAQQMPKSADRDAVIAFHGSWNRSTLAGYRVSLVLFDPVLNIPIGTEMLAGTVSKDGKVLARPVDIVQAPDGSILISDDLQGRIFRLQYVGK